MLNRTQAPNLKPIIAQGLPDYEMITLGNGTKVYLIPYPNIDVMSIEWVFDAGNTTENSPSLASFTAKMLPEGTQTKSSFEVSQFFDSYGAYFGIEASIDFSTVSLHVLSDYFEHSFELAKEIILTPALSDDEFDMQLTRLRQVFAVEEKKTTWQARKIFMQRLFGTGHPYAVNGGNEELAKMNLSLVKNFYAEKYQLNNCFVIVSGSYERNQVLDKLEKMFQNIIPQQMDWGNVKTDFVPHSDFYHLNMEGYMQSSVRIGFKGFKRNHPDVYPMRVANTVLGGYFGSRLMQNIREDKGYTYGIGSAWVSNKADGYFTISADVGADYAIDTLKQIRIEIDKMRNEKVSESELQVVKNYMLGRLASDLETPFQIAERLKYMIVYDLAPNELELNFERIQNTNPEEILQMSQKYLNLEKLTEVVCGKYA